MTERRRGGDETWFRLREWTKGQKEAERLAAHVLSAAGYQSMDPSHPLGGPDGLKDSKCAKDGKEWIGAFYFPKGEKSFSDVKSKFNDDLEGVKDNDADGISFVTNQELTLSERSELEGLSDELDIFHLERVAHILDRPERYGVRLQFLDIEMSKEEQIAFIAARDRTISRLQKNIERLISGEKPLNTDGDPEEVTPVYLSSPLTQAGSSVSKSYLDQERKVHTCSHCGFGFIVNDTSTDLLSVNYGAQKAVQCPKCGNTDRFI